MSLAAPRTPLAIISPTKTRVLCWTTTTQTPQEKLASRKRTLAQVINPQWQSTRRHGVSRGHPIQNFRANQTGTSSQTWADILASPKPDAVFRYIFQNINGLPVNPRAYKHQQIGAAFTETEADMFGFAELNLNLKFSEHQLNSMTAFNSFAATTPSTQSTSMIPVKLLYCTAVQHR
jgi:hypothetical protein